MGGLCYSLLPAFAPQSASPPGNQRTGSGLSGRYSVALACSRLREEDSQSGSVRQQQQQRLSHLLVFCLRWKEAAMWSRSSPPESENIRAEEEEDIILLRTFPHCLTARLQRLPGSTVLYTLHDNSAILTQRGDIPGVYLYYQEKYQRNISKLLLFLTSPVSRLILHLWYLSREDCL